MQYYLIYAAEQYYKGKNDCYTWDIESCRSDLEALQRAMEYSYHIMLVDEDIQNALEEKTLFLAEEYNCDPEEVRCRAEAENLLYKIYKIDMNKFKTLSLIKIENLFFKDPETFIDKYCEEI